MRVVDRVCGVKRMYFGVEGPGRDGQLSWSASNPGGERPGLAQVPEDASGLLGVLNDCDYLHLAAAVRTDERIDLVHFCKKAGAATFAGFEVDLVFGGRKRFVADSAERDRRPCHVLGEALPGRLVDDAHAIVDAESGVSQAPGARRSISRLRRRRIRRISTTGRTRIGTSCGWPGRLR